MALVDVPVCESCGRLRGERHKATTKRPSLKTMERWVMGPDAAACKATDGCVGVDPDGECEHGHTSWLRVAGFI